MSRLSIQPTLPMPTFDGTGGQVPLLLVDGHNLLWGATFGFPAPIYSRDKTRLLTGLFAFFALLRVAIRDDVPGAAPEVIVVFDGEHGAVSRQQAHDGYKASRPTDDQARLPLQFLPDVKRGLDHCGVAWIELEYAEAGDVIATVVHAITAPRHVIIMSRDRDYYQLITDRVVVLNTPVTHRAQAGDSARGVHPAPGHARPVGRFPSAGRGCCRRDPGCARHRREDCGDAAGRRLDPR